MLTFRSVLCRWRFGEGGGMSYIGTALPLTELIAWCIQDSHNYHTGLQLDHWDSFFVWITFQILLVFFLFTRKKDVLDWSVFRGTVGENGLWYRIGGRLTTPTEYAVEHWGEKRVKGEAHHQQTTWRHRVRLWRFPSLPPFSISPLVSLVFFCFWCF